MRQGMRLIPQGICIINRASLFCNKGSEGELQSKASLMNFGGSEII